MTFRTVILPATRMGRFRGNSRGPAPVQGAGRGHGASLRRGPSGPKSLHVSTFRVAAPVADGRGAAPGEGTYLPNSGITVLHLWAPRVTEPARPRLLLDQPQELERRGDGRVRVQVQGAGRTAPRAGPAPTHEGGQEGGAGGQRHRPAVERGRARSRAVADAGGARRHRPPAPGRT